MTSPPRFSFRPSAYGATVFKPSPFCFIWSPRFFPFLGFPPREFFNFDFALFLLLGFFGGPPLSSLSLLYEFIQLVVYIFIGSLGLGWACFLFYLKYPWDARRRPLFRCGPNPSSMWTTWVVYTSGGDNGSNNGSSMISIIIFAVSSFLPSQN